MKYGFYERYRFGRGSMIKVQRYWCKNHSEMKTFSILPFPYTRFLRHCLTLASMLALFAEHEARLNSELCRLFNLSRGVVKRLILQGAKITSWFQSESLYARWGPAPWENPNRQWTAFCQQLSIAIYPNSGPH